MVCRFRLTEEHSGQDIRARRAGLVHLIYFVHLVSLVQPNRPNKLEKLAGSRASRTTVCGAGELVQYPASLPFPC
jgi:hypothetical protein